MNRPIATSVHSNVKTSTGQMLALVSGLLLWGLYSAQDTDLLIGYSVVTIGAFLPAVLWLRCGSPGLPVFAVPALLYYVYYALPVLRENSLFPAEMVRDAALTAALFLATSTLAWLPFVYWISSRKGADEPLIQKSVIRLVLPGLTLGFGYHLIAMIGWVGVFGSYNGIVRAVALSASTVATYLLGYMRAKKAIDPRYFKFSICLLAGTITFSLVSLFLVTSIIYLLAGVIAYSVTARRVPWRLAVASVVVLGILHFGKGDMRLKYWSSNYDNYNSGVSVVMAPTIVAEWFVRGISSITTGEYAGRQDLFERGSLLGLLLRVQAITPEQIPYFGGETYVHLGEMLIPRFLVEDKSISQLSIKMLNVRYGFQSEEAANITAIGWGLIAEAYANFGYLGVALVGLVFGVVTGAINRITVGASALSWRNFVGVMGVMTLLNPEADLSYILTNLWQATIAIILFYCVLGPARSGKKGRVWQPS